MDHFLIHLIGSLRLGGAETVLCRLLELADRRRFRLHVVTLRPGGELVDRVRSAGVPLTSLNFKAANAPFQFARLVSLLNRQRPRAVVTWMYHANLIGSLAAKSAGGIPTIWNIRHADLPKNLVKPSTRAVIRLGAACSHQFPAAIVHVSQAGRSWHEQKGYAATSASVIPNGFDLARFQPNPHFRAQLRRELRISDDQKLIGLIGRFHPNKDHFAFLQAAATLRRRRNDVRFVLCGTDVTWENRQLTAWIEALNLTSAVHLLGPRLDIEQIHAGIDLLVSSSISEGFPNVVGEAMSSGVPCVVTDVADSALLVGDTGVIVPPGRPDAIADSCEKLLCETREQQCARSKRTRERIATEFEFVRVAERHFELWSQVATNNHPLATVRAAA